MYQSMFTKKIIVLKNQDNNEMYNQGANSYNQVNAYVVENVFYNVIAGNVETENGYLNNSSGSIMIPYEFVKLSDWRFYYNAEPIDLKSLEKDEAINEIKKSINVNDIVILVDEIEKDFTDLETILEDYEDNYTIRSKVLHKLENKKSVFRVMGIDYTEYGNLKHLEITLIK